LRRADLATHPTTPRTLWDQRVPTRDGVNLSADVYLPEDYRGLFPILEKAVHLASCSQAPLSTPVMQALAEYQASLLEHGMDWPRWTGEVARAKAAFAGLLKTSPNDIAVLASVSDAVSAVASCLPWRGRSGVVMTTHEFPTIGHVWLAAQRTGRARITFVETPDGFYGDDVLSGVVDEKLAILSVHAVAYASGTKQDVRTLARAAHERGAIILVDAYQAMGTVPMDVGRDNLDIVVSGNLKYLLGLPGTAFMYVRPELAAELEPASTGWFGRENPYAFDVRGLDFARGARRFDTGTPPIPAAYAARAGMDLIASVGVDAIRQHTRELSRFAIELALEHGLRIAGPRDPDQRGASTAIDVGPRAAEVEAEMRRRGVIVSARGPVVRLAPHFFTTRDDIATGMSVLCDAFDALDLLRAQTRA